jgi:tRNA(Ile)-lysidine synthase
MGLGPGLVEDFLKSAPPAGRLLVAFSGGLDSHVLLHLLLQAANDRALAALHVHHGLQAGADRWSEHCAAVCRGLGIPFQVLRVKVAREGQQGLEAAARDARYAALRVSVQPHDLLLTAHHQDDQAETVLLQLMRGAGPAGLAAMPRLAPFGAGWLGRPLLEVARADLEAYAREAGLRWIEDPSNADHRFDRNYLRHEIMPRLARRWPGVTRNLAVAARIQADTLEQLDTLARGDMERCRGSRPETLSVAGVNALRRGRRRNLLRLWLIDKGFEPPPRARMDSLLDSVLTAGRDRAPSVAWGEVEIRRYRDDLYAMSPLSPPAPLPRSWDPRETLRLPGLDIDLTMDWLLSRGVDPEACRAPFELGYRQGGERIRLPGREHSSELKTLMQEAGLPPWERDRLPLLWRSGRLLAVWGHWVAAPDEFSAAAGCDA